MWNILIGVIMHVYRDQFQLNLTHYFVKKIIFNFVHAIFSKKFMLFGTGGHQVRSVNCKSKYVGKDRVGLLYMLHTHISSCIVQIITKRI